jgi:hypothetical protein
LAPELGLAVPGSGPGADRFSRLARTLPARPQRHTGSAFPIGPHAQELMDLDAARLEGNA